MSGVSFWLASSWAILTGLPNVKVVISREGRRAASARTSLLAHISHSLRRRNMDTRKD